jgi:hypothetical protein
MSLKFKALSVYHLPVLFSNVESPPPDRSPLTRNSESNDKSQLSGQMDVINSEYINAYL